MLTEGARRLAAEQQRAGRPQGQPHVVMRPGKVTAVAAGAASDGAALLTVTYDGASQEVAYLASYTPTMGHNVVLLVSSDGALLCLGRAVGTP
ncbi:hypothetical protein GCM10010435_44510 [Winogradskya consettensis]|uniref:Uncharacterized protein n=1 Tax=Winogradskya consettensis TaxID=113560 RepID=A0A919T1C2_9ACTN|nr:hypothetical protein [Actinoplanes consettensis]GIM82714.1 hypothetical protein Aco04nite_82900 [Actinoplanes consettensis]